MQTRIDEFENVAAHSPFVHAAAIAALRDGHPLEIVVWGTSMWPSLRAGSRVRIDPGARTLLRPGAIVAYARSERLVVHRVIGVRAMEVICRGDNVAGPSEVVRRDDIVGGVVVVARRPLRVRVPTFADARSALRRVRFALSVRIDRLRGRDA
jgi:phage repressor protein C with HTH and peptisase S24 domain